MKLLPLLLAILILGVVAFLPRTKNDSPAQISEPLTAGTTVANVSGTSKIQVAILLDVSNSMDGLIAQAKSQLWNMVSVMGRAKCGNDIPKIEIALYEYGRDSNNPVDGYIKQVTGFSGDLDNLSQELFKLNTNGGDEYCGHVIQTSLKELPWDTLSSSYKVIFIAGNEDFLQGKVSFTKACSDAMKKGVIVNTIYCGDRMTGIREHWNLGGECGGGNYTNIDHQADIIDFPTPYDSTLFQLNSQLNGTYVAYGAKGKESYERQQKVDDMNRHYSKVSAKRVEVKGNKKLYKNTEWDLVDASEENSKFIESVDIKTLPDSLKTKSREELKQFVAVKTAERTSIQKEILLTSAKREAYMVAERERSANASATTTLESEIERIIKEQVKRYNMIIQ
ncbi:MAG: hypothetical protein H7Y42_03920 [Chitinophagaceae bacterium]|nr:hypothetical protein [Chitinophagaceae bacterium]